MALPAGAGLHGDVGYEASPPADRGEYGMGMGFCSAAWSLIDLPLARTWKEHGPTWDSVFQTVEAGYVPIVTRQEHAP